jgi:hypothetical protein
MLEAEERLPVEVAYLAGWHHELNRARGGTGFGSPATLGYPDIYAWAKLTGRQPTAEEVECLLTLDVIYIATVTAKDSDG